MLRQSSRRRSRCLGRRTDRGSVATEFMLVFPLFLLMVLIVLAFATWCIEGQLLRYAAFMGGRAMDVYQENGAKALAQSIMPGARLSYFEPGRRVGVTRDLLLPFDLPKFPAITDVTVELPVVPALGGPLKNFQDPGDNPYALAK